YAEAQKDLTSYLGIDFQLHCIKKEVNQRKVIDLINDLNDDKAITAIILLLPLPEGFKQKEIISSIAPSKDAEGVHPVNLGKLFYKKEDNLSDLIVPCTVEAVMQLLDYTKVQLKGKEVIIISHSEIIGKPLSILLLNRLATVTVCHIKTKDLKKHIQDAEIVISATGKANLIKGEWIKDKAIVIDIGTSKVGSKIVGDVEFEKAKDYASFITPVPGGVGPLTVSMLMRNIVKLYKLQRR
ncbi:MAG TPA: bifunctional 5,10-methylenetetrahydrofolate dehydrogenase/5,10-methenyltetrahydrofolate cyclohydrolase, partial [Candidatus Omnitrophica bacterium]|nr:bifunctional 5,10-methylenetetrahydrofolate dehydrogenase/5,10-methenyltetrahydrofolate cyclohydrolase [Candidatus Omnitrophota bacterium]